MNHMNQFTTVRQSSKPDTDAATAATTDRPHLTGTPHLPFEAPTLTKHGSVAALTQDFGGSFDPPPFP